MAIQKFKRHVLSAASEQKVQKPAEPEKPAKPAVPSKPSEPSKPEEPSEPTEETSSVNWDDLTGGDEEDDYETIEEPMQEGDGSEADLMQLIHSFLRLAPQPSSQQVLELASSLGVPAKDLQHVIDLELGTTTPSYGSPSSDFDGAMINPTGKTSLEQMESRAPSFASASKRQVSAETLRVIQTAPSGSKDDPIVDDDFLLPMSVMEDNRVYSSYTKVLSDSTPRNTRTGIDDGAPVTDEDDMEQDALINDGVVDLDDEITQVNNRAINDDGLS